MPESKGGIREHERAGTMGKNEIIVGSSTTPKRSKTPTMPGVTPENLWPPAFTAKEADEMLAGLSDKIDYEAATKPDRTDNGDALNESNVIEAVPVIISNDDTSPAVIHDMGVVNDKGRHPQDGNDVKTMSGLYTYVRKQGSGLESRKPKIKK